jgi:hypothetical protein
MKTKKKTTRAKKLARPKQVHGVTSKVARVGIPMKVIGVPD